MMNILNTIEAVAEVATEASAAIVNIISNTIRFLIVPHILRLNYSAVKLDNAIHNELQTKLVLNLSVKHGNSQLVDLLQKGYCIECSQFSMNGLNVVHPLDIYILSKPDD